MVSRNPNITCEIIQTNPDTLVISGGGIKGFCLLGGLEVLSKKAYLDSIINYIGTSVGSILCYLLAIGYDPLELFLEVFNNKHLEKMQNFNLVALINGDGAMSFSYIHEALEQLTINKIGMLLTLGKLKEMFGKSLYCCTYNMTTCSVEYLNPNTTPDIPCLTALRLSANIPLIFEKYKYMNSYYIDGGIVDNFPIEKAYNLSDKVLGLYLEVDEKTLSESSDCNFINYLMKLMNIPIIHATKTKITEKGMIIPIKTNFIQSMLEFNINCTQKLDMFSVGYKEVNEYLKK